MSGPQPWQAPRTAYLITAQLAGDDIDSAEKIWRDLRPFEQADVLAALAAQARQAVTAASAYISTSIMIEITAYSMRICEEAVTTLSMLSEESPGEWKMPQCGHCAEAIVSCLAGICIRMGRIRGFGDGEFAQICREAAGASRT